MAMMKRQTKNYWGTLQLEVEVLTLKLRFDCDGVFKFKRKYHFI